MVDAQAPDESNLAPEEQGQAQTPEPVAPTSKNLALIAHSYQVPMSQGTLDDIATHATPATTEQFTDYAKQMAKGLYPTFAGQLDAGLTMAHVLDPYRQVGKQMLGDQFEPDFINDPKSSAALSGGLVDPKTKTPTPMTLDQWKQHIKSTPDFGWLDTPAGRARVRLVLDSINRGFTTPPEATSGP